MSVYFMASISIRDKDEYNKYLEQVDAVFGRYRGSYLAVVPIGRIPSFLKGKISLFEGKNFKEYYLWIVRNTFFSSPMGFIT